MAKNSFTSSERRGIIAVAALALLITGCGFWLSRCGRPESTVTPAEVEVLLEGRGKPQSPDKENKDTSAKKKRSGTGNKKKSGNYVPRDILDEAVPQE
ncbi:MAG: hypothetical protein K2G52_06770 [Muribaculaceae bacterium]|nr:hypothetical protein [Muribaculaceae bacterium]